MYSTEKQNSKNRKIKIYTYIHYSVYSSSVSYLCNCLIFSEEQRNKAFSALFLGNCLIFRGFPGNRGLSARSAIPIGRVKQSCVRLVRWPRNTLPSGATERAQQKIGTQH